jgi:hypothetical protein
MLQTNSFKRSFFGLSFILALILLPVALVSGQTVSATLSGTVKDPQGAVVSGAQVTVTDAGTGVQRGVTANDEGFYTIPNLQPSKYNVLVSKTGFSSVNIKELTLNANDRRELNIEMKIGEVGVTVDVQADQVGVVKISPEVSTVVDQQFVENLPLNGRSFQSLIALTPGVIRTNTEGQFSVNGQRDNGNYFTIDGVSANIGISSSNQQSLGQGGAGQTAGFNAVGGTSGLISVDAMQEFRIQTSTYSAEFGRTPGGQIQIVSRSGKARFEGTAFNYLRNDALDANNWFNNANRLRKAPLRQNDFGIVLGGPIVFPRFGEGGPFFEKSSRTFFFFSYEGLRLRLPVTIANLVVPSLATRSAAPAILQPYLNTLPLPNGANTVNGGAFFSAAFSNPSRIDATSVRIDHNFSSNLNIFGRFNISPSVSTTRGTTVPTTLTNSRKNIKTLTLGSTQTFSSSVVNEIRGNYSKNTGSSTFTNDDFGGAVPISDGALFPSFASPETDIVDVQLGGLGAFSRGSSVENTQQQINVVDNLTWIKGNHSLKFGADYRYLFPMAQPRTYAALINFFDLTAVLNAAPQLFIALSNDRVRVKLHNLSLYGQDTWRVSRRLTLDLGLRWEYNPPPSGRDGDILYTVDQVNNPATVVLAPAGTPLYPTIKDAFAPRFGATYLLRESDQGWLGDTVVRGGFGVFYDLGSASALATTGAFPHTRANVQFNPAGFPMPFAPSVIAPPTLANFNPPFTNQDLLGFDQDYSLPRTYQWNVAVEQEIGKNQTLSVSYVGAGGRKLLRQERNLPPAGTGRFLNLFVYRNSDSSDYNAMQIQFTRRLTRGFQALANYTWAKSFDTSSTDSPPSNAVQGGANQLNIATERGLSSFDVRHNFNLTTTYEIPTISQARFAKAFLGGWALDSIFSARSGLPINITATRNLGFGSIGTRPDLVPGAAIWIDDPLAPGGRRLNPAAFSIPTTVRQGNMQRNSIHGFPFWQLDFALRRQFNLGERVRLQLKGELFNALNHPNFNNPNSNLGNVNAAGVLSPSATFGRSTSMLANGLAGSGFSSLYQPGGPRSVQLTIKLSF